jgi:hypothetical protein
MIWRTSSPGRVCNPGANFFSAITSIKILSFSAVLFATKFLHDFGNPNRQRTLHKNLPFFQNKRRGFQKILPGKRSAASGLGKSPPAGSL